MRVQERRTPLLKLGFLIFLNFILVFLIKNGIVQGTKVQRHSLFHLVPWPEYEGNDRPQEGVISQRYTCASPVSSGQTPLDTIVFGKQAST